MTDETDEFLKALEKESYIMSVRTDKCLKGLAEHSFTLDRDPHYSDAIKAALMYWRSEVRDEVESQITSWPLPVIPLTKPSRGGK